jgi:hypothetical protein
MTLLAEEGLGGSLRPPLEEGGGGATKYQVGAAEV